MSPYFHQYCYFLFFDYCHASECEVVLICIFLMANDIKQLLMWLLTICMSFMKECLCKFFAQFLIGLSVFLLLSCNGSLYILDIRLIRYVIC